MMNNHPLNKIITDRIFFDRSNNMFGFGNRVGARAVIRRLNLLPLEGVSSTVRNTFKPQLAKLRKKVSDQRDITKLLDKGPGAV